MPFSQGEVVHCPWNTHTCTQAFIEVAKIIDTPALTHYSILGKHNSDNVKIR